MTRVQEPEFHLLVGQDVTGNLCSDLFPGRSPLDELILNNPLSKGFRHYWPTVNDAKLFGQQRSMRLRRCRRDPIYHAVGKSPVLLEPVAQSRVTQLTETRQHLAQDFAVALEVVARQ